jgi:hypothetical protein
LGIAVERKRALVGHEVIGFGPVLADDDGISADAADLLDKAGKVPAICASLGV